MFSNRIGKTARRAAGSVLLAGVIIGVPALGVAGMADASPNMTPKTDVYSPGATCYDAGLGVGYTC